MLNKLCQSTDARKLHLLLDCSIRAELNLLHVGVIKGFFRDRQVEDRANATLKLLRHCVPLTLIALPHHLLRIIEVVRNAFRGHVEVVYSIPQPCSTCIICRKNIWCFRVIPHPPPSHLFASAKKTNRPAATSIRLQRILLVNPSRIRVLYRVVSVVRFVCDMHMSCIRSSTP